MDKFEEMMQMMQGMSEEERMQSIQEKKNICTCAGCPSYNECAQQGNELE